VIYVACSNGVQALAYNQAARTFASIWKGPSDAAGPPIVSAGLVWVVATHGSTPGGKLYGLDPATGAPRYTETLPSAAIDHFASPSAAGGRLFLASGSTVSAYLIAVPPPGSPPAPSPPVTLPMLAGSTHPAAPMARLLGTVLTVSRSGWLKLRVRCPSGVRICRGTLVLRTVRAVIASAGSRARVGRRRAAVLTLASGTFRVAGGHVATVSLRMGPRARRLLLRKHVLHARATVTMRSETGTLQSSRTAVTLRLARRR
jgi:hypothetical protein